MYDFDEDPKRIKDKLFCSMSAHFLTNELPVEAMDWEHEKIEVWIDENRWEHFDFWDTHDIVELIESATWHAFEFMKENWKELSLGNAD